MKDKTTKRINKNNIGAPAQHAQSSRKGKRAWRKNVDLIEIEGGLEGLRDEERLTGGILQKKTDDELFQIDVTGDAQVKRALRSSTPLKSTLILSARSAVPPVFTHNAKRHGLLTREEKVRLLKIGKRKQKLLGSHVESAEIGGIELDNKNEYDIWEGQGSEDEKLEKALKTDEAKDYILSLVKKPKIKAPITSDPRQSIALAAIESPHPGTSYNPTITAHAELLQTAAEIEGEKEKEKTKFASLEETWEAAKRRQFLDETDEGAPSGMKIDIMEDIHEDEDQSVEVVRTEKIPARKTKQQRQKVARVLAEKRAAAERAARRRQAATIGAIKSLRQSVESTLSAREQLLTKKREVKLEDMRKGLAGKRLGRHKVPETVVDVQLGDELSETLRELKPEGNLFKDRFLSLQHRALVEPRALVLRKGRTLKYKEYEKHPWKRFA